MSSPRHESKLKPAQSDTQSIRESVSNASSTPTSLSGTRGSRGRSQIPAHGRKSSINSIGNNNNNNGSSNLRKFLNAKKRELQMGPPPTATESLLNSHLEGSEKEKERRRRRLQSKSSLAKGKKSEQRDNGITISNKQRAKTQMLMSQGKRNRAAGRGAMKWSPNASASASAWNRVQVNAKVKTNSNISRIDRALQSQSSAKTLDDLLAMSSRGSAKISADKKMNKRVGSGVNLVMGVSMSSSRGCDETKPRKASTKLGSNKEEKMVKQTQAQIQTQKHVKERYDKVENAKSNQGIIKKSLNSVTNAGIRHENDECMHISNTNIGEDSHEDNAATAAGGLQSQPNNTQSHPNSKTNLVLQLPRISNTRAKVNSMKRKRFAYTGNNDRSTTKYSRATPRIVSNDCVEPEVHACIDKHTDTSAVTENTDFIHEPTAILPPLTTPKSTETEKAPRLTTRNGDHRQEGCNDTSSMKDKNTNTSTSMMNERTIETATLVNNLPMNQSTQMPSPIPAQLLSPPSHLQNSPKSIPEKFQNHSQQREYQPRTKKKAVNNDNFVRLNLKNTAGACRGAKSGFRKHNRMKRRRAEYRMENHLLGVEKEERNENDGDGDANTSSNGNVNASKGRRKNTISINAAIDPLDDFLDGKFSSHTTPKSNAKTCAITHGTTTDSTRPSCPRHNRPCKLLIVKKNTSGNKGRKFYACSMPRGEQCDFFQWEDDTVEAVTSALLHSSSKSGFVARQVANHVDRLKILTVPELKMEAKRRGLNTTGKKNSILARLSVWTRDEVSNSLIGRKGDDEGGKSNVNSLKDDGDKDTAGPNVFFNAASELNRTHTDLSENVPDEDIEPRDEVSSCGSSSSCDDEYVSSDEEELEIFGVAGFAKKNENNMLNGEADAVACGYSRSPLHSCLQSVFGFENFREGQEWAIQRCLSKKRSLLVAPTGLGKSLCYSLPAVLMDGVCIVVSPLVSLMEDQLRHLPPAIPAATLSGKMSAKRMAIIIDDLLRNRLKILFMSPERLASAAFRRLLRPKYNIEKKKYERQLPKISLLCVDEAHCLSQWGHNFRSAYLRLRTLLSKLEPESVLALTATAGPPCCRDICHELQIPLGNSQNRSVDNKEDEEFPQAHQGEEDNGVKVLSCNRDNIDISVSFMNEADERLQMLLKILRPPSENRRTITNSSKNQSTMASERLLRQGILSSGSVIVYVWRQRDAEVITEQLKGYDLSGGIVCYHGGMDSSARSKSQSQFMRGKARICVATVAFGLGINKSDVRGVVHLCLPPSPEHYLQEIGRAGRDGMPATAIALVLENEASHKLSLSYSDRISKSQIHTLLLNMQQLIKENLALGDKCKERSFDPSSRSQIHLALPITPLVQTIDCKQETIETILSILEDSSPNCKKLLDIEGSIPDVAIVTLKKQEVEKLALTEDVVKCIQICGERIDTGSSNDGSTTTSGPHYRFAESGGTAAQKGFLAYSFGVIQFSITKCAYLLGPTAEPRHIYAALRRLQDNGELELTFNNEGQSIHVRINPDGLSFFTNRDDKCLRHLSTNMCHHFSAKDDRRAEKVVDMHNIMLVVSANHQEDSKLSNKKEKSKRLKIFQEKIHQYFADTKEDELKSTKAIALSKDRFLGLGVQLVHDSDRFFQNKISADVNMLLQHPSLTKPYSSFSKSIKFGHSIDCDYDYTSLSITKILHGIDSPRSPTLSWYNHPLWGSWRSHHFLSLQEYIESLLEDNIG